MLEYFRSVLVLGVYHFVSTTTLLYRYQYRTLTCIAGQNHFNYFMSQNNKITCLK